MRSIPCPLYINAQRIPRTEAIVWGRRVIEWDPLNSYVHSTARYLKEIGVGPAARVTVFAKNCVEYVITLISLWRVGACVMPVSVYLAPPVLEEVLKNFHPDFMFFGEPLPFKVEGAKTYPLDSLVSFTFTDGFFGREAYLNPNVDLESAAAVVLTSGSTGLPKGALLSYGNFHMNAVGANEFIPFQPSDRWLLSLPLWHVSGLSIIFRALQGGGAIVLPERDEMLEEAVVRYRPTHLSLVPVQLRRILIRRVEVDGPGLKAILLGGGPIPSSLAKEAVKAGFPVYATYGLTETASQVATGIIDHDGIARVWPLKYREVKIDKEGEVLVRGAVLFRRYLFGGQSSVIDADGWYHTGDLCELGGDGRFRIKGRRDNMFISGGENIYPETVENALLDHPAIEQAVVIGVHDDEFGHRPVAFVHFKETAAAASNELSAFLRSLLSRHEIPRTYYAWPVFENSAGLKTERKRFLELVLNKKAIPIN